MNKSLSRRDFLKLAGVTSAGLALSACGVNATDLPTATSIPPTGTSFPTETLTPTLTSTPILPLEQLPQTKQALGEFVRVFQAAGVDISTEQLIQKGLNNITATGMDEKQYDIAFVQVENYGNYPLIIKKTDDGKWSEVNGINTKPITGIDMGVFVGGYGFPDYYNLLKETQKRFFSMPSVFMSWKDVSKWGSEGVDDDYKTACAYNTENIMLHPLIWENELPDNINILSGETLRAKLLEFVRTTVKTYPKVTMFTLNEMSDEFLGKIGSTQEQQEFIHSLSSIIKDENPNRLVILNDTLNHGSDSYNGNKNKRTEKSLENFAQDIDVLGIELSVDAGHVPPEGWQEMIYDRMKFYYQNYGKKMIVSEFSVNIKDVQGANRVMTQSDIYEQLVAGIQRANKELGNICKLINVLTIGDKFSPFKRTPTQFGYSKISDVTMFDDELLRKAAWFGTMKGLFSVVAS